MTAPRPMASGTDTLAVALAPNWAIPPPRRGGAASWSAAADAAGRAISRWASPAPALVAAVPHGAGGRPPDQPDHLNAVVLLVGLRLDPDLLALLLLELQALERRIGRGPRLLDLDLLRCSERVCRQRELELPHPVLPVASSCWRRWRRSIRGWFRRWQITRPAAAGSGWRHCWPRA